ncbi:MAG: GTPase Era [Chloroflexi bacterium]|nr:MAG: GTPase Era [Chloroflexota bacterium]MBL1197280.1 GTPase Era [Chloroflexota bacterium]NOH14575.1 GTPase Era [Chloroflexota bacterium]
MENPEQNNFKSGFVAVVGRPNVGKSTLINRFLGQKIAAVSPKPQTTRHQQLGILTLGEAQIIFTDTPGMHLAHTKLGERMNQAAENPLADSDAILFLVDLSQAPHEEDHILAEKLKALREAPPVLMVLNKVDMLEAESLEGRQSRYQALLPEAQAIPISATEGHNIAELLEVILAHLPPGPPFYPEDQITDLYERDIAADLIREAALNNLQDEVPHGIAVRIDEFTERGEDGAYIEATLFVERESHKGIVIGAGGEMIKTISTQARKEIEKMSGRKVFLRLRAKVRKNWRNDDFFLKSFTFGGEQE